MSLLKAMAAVGGLTFVSRVAGFARDLITSHTLGAGPVADAFFVALKLPNFFRSITAEGAFSISFVPLYTDQTIQQGQGSASDFASTALSFMVLVLLPFSVLMMWAMPWVMIFLAPGFENDPYRFDLAVEMARLSFPYLLLVTIAAILGAVLNAHQKFGPYAFAPVIFNLCLIVSVVFTPLFETQGHAMAVFMSLSGALQALWVWAYIRRMNIGIRFVWPRLSPEIRLLFKNMGPGILVAGIFQVNLFMNLMIGSFLAEGAISHLYYADRLYQLPFGVIGIAIGTALLPLFSAALTKQDMTETKDLFSRSVEYVLILCLPCAFGLLLAAEPLIQTIFEHGAFTADDTRSTTLVMMAYALGLPAYVLTRIYNAAFYAQKDTWTPVKISMITTAANIILSILLAFPFGVMGIALSTSVCGWILLYLLLVAARRSTLPLYMDERLSRNLPKIFFSCGLLITGLVMMRYGFDYISPSADSWALRAAELVALIAVSFSLYFPALFFTRAIRTADVKRYLTRKGRSLS
jgi:putative peptidoglycan lipid II flippase